MKLREQYDWVVIGDHPAALLSGGLAARLGLSVLVLDLGEPVRAGLTRGGQVYDPEPAAVPAVGGTGAPEGLLGRAFKLVGIDPLAIDGTGARFPLEVATPDVRARVGGGLDQTAREIARESGFVFEDVLALLLEASECQKRFWDELPSRLSFKSEPVVPAEEGPASKAAAKKPAPPSVEPPEKALMARLRGRRGFTGIPQSLRHAGDALAFALGVTGSVDESAAFWNNLASTTQLRNVSGGWERLRSLLRRACVNLGAHVPERGDCRRIFIESGRLVGVQVAHHGSGIGATGGVLGVPLARVGNLIEVSGKSLVHTLKPAAKPLQWRFTLALTIRHAGIPEQISPRVIWKEAGAPPLAIEFVDPASFGAYEAGHWACFLRTVLPMDGVSAEDLRLVAARMFRQFTELFPDADRHLVRLYPDFRSPGATEFADLLARVPTSAGLWCGFSENRLSSSGVEGLFIAANEIHSEHGLLGPYLAGFEAAAWIAQRHGIPGPLG